MSATAPDWYENEDPPLSEGEKVRQWRENEFLRLGYHTAEAFWLASTDADLALVRRLIEQGCAPDLAARIAS